MLVLALALLCIDPAQAQAPAPPPRGLKLSQGAWKAQIDAADLPAGFGVMVQEVAPGSLDLGPRPPLRLSQTAAEIALQGPAGFVVDLRAEDGLLGPDPAHAVEAWAGVALARGSLGLWMGRNDLPVTRDRLRENEELALSWRPLLSTAAGPLNVDGVGLGLAWPGKLTLRGGAAWPDLGEQAPRLWFRGDIHPMGPPPDREDDAVPAFAFRVGGGGFQDRGTGLGLWDADLELRLGPAVLGADWIQLRGTGQEPPLREWILSLGSEILPLANGGISLHLRGERLTGLDPAEGARWLPAGRLAWRGADGAVQIYAESALSFEVPELPALPIARENGLVALGMLARW